MGQTTQGLLGGARGERLLALGNEAFARGAIEARVQVATGYPGTPSTEILETLIAAAPRLGFEAFWAVNEKVAFDIGTGASFSGARALVVLKHVGLNVAADSLLQVNLVDIEGGLVVVSVDDPGGTSSNNEQDNRWYAKMAEIPCLEPGSLDEAREMTRRAFEISESLKVPVLVRSVTRLAHMTSELTLGALAPERPKPRFDSTRTWSPFPPLAPHRRLQEKLARAGKLLESGGFDAYEGTGRERFGVAAAGFAYNYAREAIEGLGMRDEVALVKVTTANPLPRALLSRLLDHVERVLVVEDVSPYLEEALLAEAGALGKKVRIEGRRSGALPGAGETLPDLVLEALADMVGVSPKPKRRQTVETSSTTVPRRQISFCSGCSHRSTYYALAQAFEGSRIEDPIVVGDIGCYTLGFFPPFNILQTMTSMGASMGTAAALARLNPERKVVAVIGDSTLYHAGIPGLVQIAHLRLPVTVLVMDNSVTGSTGQQPHPGSWQHGDDRTVVPIEDIARACGFPFVRVVGSFQLKRLPGILEEALRQEGPALVVSRQACALEPSEIGRRTIVARIDEALCDGCLACVDEFGCPAFVPAPSGSGKIEVDAIECNGCASCKFVCPPGAISFVRRDELLT
jgi:indolepyruvate ferredoxin oxidoreductase alpha subunit